jgi:hypothetical protein
MNWSFLCAEEEEASTQIAGWTNLFLQTSELEINRFIAIVIPFHWNHVNKL